MFASITSRISVTIVTVWVIEWTEHFQNITKSVYNAIANLHIVTVISACINPPQSAGSSPMSSASLFTCLPASDCAQLPLYTCYYRPRTKLNYLYTHFAHNISIRTTQKTDLSSVLPINIRVYRNLRTQQMSVLVLLCTSYTTCFGPYWWSSSGENEHRHLLRTEVSIYIDWYTRNRMHNPIIKFFRCCKGDCYDHYLAMAFVYRAIT
jgi:hypothetical protein